MKCEFCLSDIYKEDSMVRYQEVGQDRLKKAHLSCFLRIMLYNFSSKGEISLSDVVTIDADGVCCWCRRQPIPIIQMGRSGQVVCLQCLHRLVAMLSRWYAENLGLRRYEDAQYEYGA